MEAYIFWLVWETQSWRVPGYLQVIDRKKMVRRQWKAGGASGADPGMWM